jgi:Ran GTPase-activating protein (RanGAP) involved in mRNA processing and transport
LRHSFGRYPHRNDLLQRTSTPEETHYLTTEKQPVWAQLGATKSTAPSKRLRVLVLHGHKQNATSFKKSTKKILRPLASLVELVFVDSPHFYQPPEATGSDMADHFQKSAHNKTFWHMSDDPSTMHYTGLEDSIRYIDEKCRDEGPFQGIIGFSQGGCLAALLALLQDRHSPRVLHCEFQFVVMISAFLCRDVRPEFCMLEGGGQEGIALPSFHSWGLADALMHPARSEALAGRFRGSVAVTHPGGHFSGLSQWPVQALVQWLHDIRMLRPHSWTSSPSSVDTVEPELASVSPKESFREKIECTFSLNKERLCSTKNKDALILRPYGLKNIELFSCPFWQRLHALNPLYESKGVTSAAVDAFVDEAWRAESVEGEEEDGDPLLPYNDLLLLAYCLFPYASKACATESKRDMKLRLETDGEVFYWMWTGVVKRAWCASGQDSTLLCSALCDLQQYSHSFEPFLRVDLLLSTGCSLRHNEHDSDSFTEVVVLADEFGLMMHRCIAAVMSDQLLKDEDALNRLKAKESAVEKTENGGLSTYDTNVTKMLNLATERILGEKDKISNVARSIPNTRGALQKRTRLRSDIDAHFYTLRYGSPVSETTTFDEAKTIYSRIKTKEAVAQLKEFLNRNAGTSKDSLHLLKAKEVAVWKANTYQARQHMTEEDFQLRLQEPLSYAVTHPEPEPVVISTEEEMAPLYSFLETPKQQEAKDRPEAAAAPVLGANGDLVFNKGALCMDGRLDLCKQVIGPRGIDSLIKSLALDHDATVGQHRVQHLLLGNNICGDGLGQGVADLINRKQSGLKTWYIAGNRLTALGISPVCKALVGDTQVEQLWLKRNPLGPGGCYALSTMLRSNAHLVVLDLTNTAIMHEGAVVILSSLGYRNNSQPEVPNEVNNTLRHLYLDSNGLQIETAKAIADYLSTGQNRLITLSVACNRFGNEGTKHIAAAMQKDSSVQRLVLASVGMGEEGAGHLARMLGGNSSLLHLDLGLMKSTAALSELPNRVGSGGAIALASSLRGNNTTLRSLSLLYNNIHQVGLEALKDMLSSTGTTDPPPAAVAAKEKYNTTLTKLVFDQIGVPFNEFTKEEIKLCLRRNYLLLSEHDKDIVEEAVAPSHLREIVSVYRVNGNYSH